MPRQSFTVPRSGTTSRARISYEWNRLLPSVPSRGLWCWARPNSSMAWASTPRPGASCASPRPRELASPPSELPYPDSAAWIDHPLPVAAPRAHPFLARMGHGELLDRPDAAQLSYVEGLLRSLALTVEDDLAAGRRRETLRSVPRGVCA